MIHPFVFFSDVDMASVSCDSVLDMNKDLSKLFKRIVYHLFLHIM